MNPLREAGGALPRLGWLRVTLLAACLLTMLASAPLWLNSRPYPPLPVAQWFPVLSGPWDQLAFGLVLASLAAALWRYRPAVICFLAGSLFLALLDQARWQPWFYMYWIMLLLTLAEENLRWLDAGSRWRRCMCGAGCKSSTRTSSTSWLPDSSSRRQAGCPRGWPPE